MEPELIPSLPRNEGEVVRDEIAQAVKVTSAEVNVPTISTPTKIHTGINDEVMRSHAVNSATHDKDLRSR